MRRFVPVLILTACVLAAGCTKSMTPGKLDRVQAFSDNQRAGNAYLLRGWLGIFSAGIDNLTKQINENGVRANVYQDDQWAALAKQIKKEYRGKTNSEPLVLIGHSYGADDVIRIARELEQDKIEVALLVTLDPVTPPAVPSNVVRCVNIYRSNGVWDTLPVLRGVPVRQDTNFVGEMDNYNIREDRKDLMEPGTDHFNIEKSAPIHNEIIKQVLAACPPRGEWAAAKFGPTHSAAAVANAIPANAVISPPGTSAAGNPVAVHNTQARRLAN